MTGLCIPPVIRVSLLGIIRKTDPSARRAQIGSGEGSSTASLEGDGQDHPPPARRSAGRSANPCLRPASASFPAEEIRSSIGVQGEACLVSD